MTADTKGKFGRPQETEYYVRLRVSVRRSDNLEATEWQISALLFTQRRTRERNSCLHLVHNVLLR